MNSVNSLYLASEFTDAKPTEHETQHTSPDYEAIKAKQKATWSAGDYSRIGTTLQIVGEALAETLDLRPGSRVLDAAAGNGNATLAFARRWHDVTSTDYVDSLLINGRKRAEAEGCHIRFQIADVEALPFTDGEYDAVVSTFGAMFAPNQEQVARELVRVCRPGGKIGLANWTPDSFIGEMFKTIGRHVPPPAGVKSPALWGDRDWLAETFAAQESISIRFREFVFRYKSPRHFEEVFRSFYGPVHKAFEALNVEGQNALSRDLMNTIARFDKATDGSMNVPAKYAEVVVTK